MLPLLPGRNSHCGQVQYLPVLTQPHPRRLDISPSYASHGAHHETALGPRPGNPLVHWPDSVRSAPTTIMSDGSVSRTTPAESMARPSWEIRKHFYKQGTKSSSNSKKMDTPSTSSSKGGEYVPSSTCMKKRPINNRIQWFWATNCQNYHLQHLMGCWTVLYQERLQHRYQCLGKRKCLLCQGDLEP